MKRPPDAEAMRTAFAAAKLVAPGTEVPPSAVVHAAATSQVGLLATAPSADTMPSKPPTIEDPPPAKRPPTVLLALGAVIVLGGAAFGLRRMMRSSSATPDAAVIAVVQDAPPVAVLDAFEQPIPSAPADMIELAAGDYALGEPAGTHPDALAPTTVALRPLWIDRTEMTLETLRRALASPKAGGLPGDAPALPARNVTWAQAGAACKALGKRLPTELEWEAAAQQGAQDRALASLLRGKAVLTASTAKDCSALGLCDMLGSVLEWTTSDGTKRGTRIVRGASFTVSPDAGWQASIHFRVGVDERRGDPEVGFRCVQDAVLP
jgi:formylglycine-generating enzyme required for sulfatase activity